MKRFQNISKYRNSVISAANRDEQYLLSAQACDTSTSDHCPIACSRDTIAFRNSAFNIGFFPLESYGRPQFKTALHGSQISHIDWILDNLISSADDGTVKLFKNLYSDPICENLCHLKNRVEHFAVSPSSTEILAVASQSKVSIWDIMKCTSAFEIETADVVQEISWYYLKDLTLRKSDSSSFATISKDNKLRIFDPRISSNSLNVFSYFYVRRPPVTME